MERATIATEHDMTLPTARSLLAAAVLALVAQGCGEAALRTSAPPPAAAPAEATVLTACAGVAEVKPRAIVLSCGDANARVSSLRWRDWGYPTATAAGVGEVNACEPNCASGREVTFPVTVLASRLELQEATAAYRRLIVTARGSLPAGVPRREVYAIDDAGLRLVSP